MTLGGFKNKLKLNVTNILSTSGVEEGRIDSSMSEFAKGGMDLTMVRGKRGSGTAKTGAPLTEMGVGSMTQGGEGANETGSM